VALQVLRGTCGTFQGVSAFAHLQGSTEGWRVDPDAARVKLV
jgi:hypothetical protein